MKRGKSQHDTQGKSHKEPTIGDKRYGIRYALRGANLPAHRSVERRGHQLRRILEAETLANKGKITVTDASRINTAVRWEVHANLITKWLEQNEQKMKMAERLSFSKEAVHAIAKRDELITQLNLDVPSQDVAQLQEYLKSKLKQSGSDERACG